MKDAPLGILDSYHIGAMHSLCQLSGPHFPPHVWEDGVMSFLKLDGDTPSSCVRGGSEARFGSFQRHP